MIASRGAQLKIDGIPPSHPLFSSTTYSIGGLGHHASLHQRLHAANNNLAFGRNRSPRACRVLVPRGSGNRFTPTLGAGDKRDVVRKIAVRAKLVKRSRNNRHLCVERTVWRLAALFLPPTNAGRSRHSGIAAGDPGKSLHASRNRRSSSCLFATS